MSTTLVTNRPVAGAAVRVTMPGVELCPSDAVELSIHEVMGSVTRRLGVTYLNGREARMVASRLIRAAGKIARRAASK